MGSSIDPPQTLIEQAANKLGFQTLAQRYQWLPNPLICYGVFMFLLDIAVLQPLKELTGYQAAFVSNPAWVIQPLLGLAAPFVVVYLHRRYATALAHMDIDARSENPDAFATLAPLALRPLFYSVIIGYSFWAFFIDRGISEIMAVGGIAELIGVGVVLPLGYQIIFSEFLVTYIGIVMFFPRKIRHSDFKLNFLDPEGLGGLRPAGELMKLAYYFIVAGLLGYVIQLYVPGILSTVTGSPYSDPGTIDDILFTLLWLLTIATMIFGFSQLHWFMKREKRKELTRLDKEGRDLVRDPFDMSTFEIRDEKQYDELSSRIEHINNTQEYPTTFTMWIQLLIGLILPKAVQLLFGYL